MCCKNILVQICARGEEKNKKTNAIWSICQPGFIFGMEES